MKKSNSIFPINELQMPYNYKQILYTIDVIFRFLCICHGCHSDNTNKVYNSYIKV